MADSEYQSVERVLRLLLYLLNTDHGATRKQIYERIPAYQQAASESAQRRMFERDLKQIEQVGFCVSRKRHGPGFSIGRATREPPKLAIYKVSMPFKESC